MNLENYAVRRYLNSVQYPDDDYSFTLIEDYCNLDTPYRKDRPASVPIRWTTPDGCVSQKLLVSDSKDFSSVREYALDKYDSKYNVYNLIPGKTYHYKIEAIFADGKTALAANSTFRTDGTRRYLYIDDINNVRDLGGLRTIDGKKRIRYGKLFRGSEMQGKRGLTLTDLGREQMRAEKIAFDMDFRKDDEVLGITKSPIGDDIQFIRYPKANQHYTNVFNSNSYVRAVRDAIKFFMANPDKAIYFHCAVGADRTGMFAFFIEGLCGVSENDMCKDYELTSFSVPPGVRRRTTKPYDYAGFVALIKNLPGNTLQDKCREYLTSGVVAGGDKIGTTPVDSLAWLRSFLLEDFSQAK